MCYSFLCFLGNWERERSRLETHANGGKGTHASGDVRERRNFMLPLFAREQRVGAGGQHLSITISH